MTPEPAVTPTTATSPGPDRTQCADLDQLTRAQKALLTLAGDVARQLAEDHGVCVRPLAMRRIDLSTGRVDVVPVPCGSRREDLCTPCANKQRPDPDPGPEARAGRRALSARFPDRDGPCYRAR